MIEVKANDIEKVEKVGTGFLDEDRLKESNDFALKHDTIQERVKFILKFDKFARKDDLFLLLLYYVKCNMIKLIVPLSDFHNIHKPESITRAKRYLFQKAKKGDKELRFLLDDKDNLEIRNKQEENYRDYYNNKKELDKGVNAKWIK